MPTFEEPGKERELRPEPQAGQYAMVRPEDGGEEKLSVRERLKDILALILAAYSLLWKPLVCVLAGSVFAYLIVHWLIAR